MNMEIGIERHNLDWWHWSHGGWRGGYGKKNMRDVVSEHKKSRIKVCKDMGIL
jgi:hypothetical protein